MTMALVDAGIPIRDYLLACTATVAFGGTLLDVSKFENEAGAGALTVAILHADKQIVAMDVDGLVAYQYMNEVIRAAIEGVDKIHAMLEDIVREKYDRTIAYNHLE